jgi:hypothetical protein
VSWRKCLGVSHSFGRIMARLFSFRPATDCMAAWESRSLEWTRVFKSSSCKLSCSGEADCGPVCKGDVFDIGTSDAFFYVDLALSHGAYAVVSTPPGPHLVLHARAGSQIASRLFLCYVDLALGHRAYAVSSTPLNPRLVLHAHAGSRIASRPKLWSVALVLGFKSSLCFYPLVITLLGLPQVYNICGSA